MNWDAGIAVLRERSFVRYGEGDKTYVGKINTRFGVVPVKLHLDPRGIRAPVIQLIEKPHWLPRFSGHLTSDNILCYVDETLAHVNRRDSAAVVEDVLAYAQATIEQLVDFGGQVDQEFPILWTEGELCILPPWSEAEDWYWCEAGDESSPFYCFLQTASRDELDAVTKIRSAVKIPPPIRLHISRVPFAAGPGWPVTSLKDFFDWLTFIDREAGKKALGSLHELASNALRDGFLPTSIVFFVEHESSTFGLFSTVKQGSIWLPKGPELRRLKSDVIVNHWLRTRGDSTIRLWARSLDARTIIQRAMGATAPSFAGKKIAMLGTGSVGSFLADALVRCGAGSAGGELRLIDFDSVSVNNLARANFVLAEVGLKKVEALRRRLLGAWPRISISTVPDRAENVADVLDADFVFDSTGDIAFSSWLSQERNLRSGPPLLTVWIVGAGRAVQSYLQQGGEQACLACLDTANPSSLWSAAQSNAASEIQVGPCGDSFMPYSVSAPYVASGHAIAHALQFLAGAKPPALRTTFRSAIDSKRVREQAPPRCQQCQ